MQLFLILFAVTAAVTALTFYTYRICFYSDPNRDEDPYLVIEEEQYLKVSDLMIRSARIMDDASFEQVSITSYDGTLLYGKFYEFHKGAPLKILFHGYRGSALRECCGSHALARKLGMNVLAVDQRAHGKSQGNTISFGIRERFDCLCWTKFAAQRVGTDTPIILSGLSMGAATVLMASELELPRNVVCIVADCPYSTPKEIILKVCRDERYPAKLAYPFIRLGARILGRFNMEESSALQAVRNTKLPILLLHGEDDRFVPCQMSRDIYNACAGRAELHTFPDAGHGLCYMTDPVRYEKVVVDFLFTIPELRDHLNNDPYAKEVHSQNG